MTDLQSFMAPTYTGLADLLTSVSPDTWAAHPCARTGTCAT